MLELVNHVKSIAKELDDIVRCDAIEDEDLDENEVHDLYEYFDDALDVQYLVNADRSYHSVRVMISYGGPTVYVSTITGKVELYWWTDEASYPLAKETIEAIDELFEEMYMAACL